MNKKLLTAVIIFIVTILAMPVMAETDATSTDMYTAPSRSGRSGIDTQSPVLDGGAFTQYDTVFFHGAMAEADRNNPWGVYLESDWCKGHYIVLNPSTDLVFVNCPYFSYDSKQGGIQPQVKYLGLQYQTSNESEIYKISVYNGASWVKEISIDPPLKSPTDYTVKVIDLGGWYRFNRGLNMLVWIQNPSSTSYGTVYIGGYGARFEW